MTDEARRRLTAGLTAEEAEERIKRFEEMTADLDRYIAQHWTGGNEDGKTETEKAN